QSPQSQLNSFTKLATIARQSGGSSLFAQYDTAQPTAPARPALTATETSTSGLVSLSWQAPDNGGSPITNYAIYRGTSPGGEKLLTNVGTHLSYQDAKVKQGTTYYYKLVATNKVGSSQPSPEVTPTLVNLKPMCTVPGQTVLTDPAGDQVGAPNNADLDILSLAVAEPGNTSDFVFTLQVSDLSNPGPLHQWRILFPTPDGTQRYVGMDTDATGAASFVYGTTDSTSGAVLTTNTGLPGSGYTADGTITIVVPKSAVGSPAAGSTLSNLRARTFAAQGGVTILTAPSIDTTSSTTYTVVGNSYCQ
ncbi:MAG TPA: fibronectin type III domain-containing protein, partial [Chloroflexota bacterium]